MTAPLYCTWTLSIHFQGRTNGRTDGFSRQNKWNPDILHKCLNPIAVDFMRQMCRTARNKFLIILRAIEINCGKIENYEVKTGFNEACCWLANEEEYIKLKRITKASENRWKCKFHCFLAISHAKQWPQCERLYPQNNKSSRNWNIRRLFLERKSRYAFKRIISHLVLCSLIRSSV